MFKETKIRSVVKTISWRVFATITTATLVFLFTKRVDIALTIGGLEVIAKIIIYFFHERVWDKLKFGRKELDSFVVWLTGLPSSGKSTIAKKLSKKLKKSGIKVQIIDSSDVRPLFPEVGFTEEERKQHIKRVGHLASILEKNNVSSVTSFISPYKESREFVKQNCKNFIEVYVKASIESCKKRDNKGLYQKAVKGELKNFTGVTAPYEEPADAEVVVDTDSLTVEQSVEKIFLFIKKKGFLG